LVNILPVHHGSYLQKTKEHLLFPGDDDVVRRRYVF
jgi:hypothetical protein